MVAITSGADLRSCPADSKEMGRKDDTDFPAKNVLWLPRWQSGSKSRRVLRQSDVPNAHMDALAPKFKTSYLAMYLDI